MVAGRRYSAPVTGGQRAPRPACASPPRYFSRIVEIWNPRQDIDAGQTLRFTLQGLAIGLGLALLPTAYALVLRRRLRRGQEPDAVSRGRERQRQRPHRPRPHRQAGKRACGTVGQAAARTTAPSPPHPRNARAVP